MAKNFAEQIGCNVTLPFREMRSLIYKDLSTSDSIEECRELCNELMNFQASRSKNFRDALAKMNFDNRLKVAFDNAQEKFLLTACDAEPVGYIFCEAFTVTEEIKNFRFDWLKNLPADSKGLYPEDLPVPTKAAHLNNLYVKPTYRNMHIGRELMRRGMEWLRRVPDAKYIFVHVSEGNDAGAFYERYGFRYSHAAFGGMIDAYYMKLGS